MAHVDEPVTDEFLAKIEALFQLAGGYAEVGEQLAYVPQPRQYAVTMYSILAMRQAIDQFWQEHLTVPRGVSATAAELPLVVQARNWHYVPVFTVSSVVCGLWGAETSDDLLTLVLDHINAQNVQFKRDYLPRGYLESDPAAVSSLKSFVRRKLRHCWGRVRDLLLSAIQPGTGGNVTHPVPSVSALIADMRAALIPPNANQPEAEAGNDRANQSHLKARIAYLQVQTVAQARAANTVQRGFYQLVLRYDHATFGQQYFADMDPESIKLPMEEEVQERMRENAAKDKPAKQEALNG
ncbi:hypothetical protein PtA15_3A228 [Puccinia triticina]|uniref:Uncharacterized protein n=1 Tax=Puccinia triticina TaxID=208348 RepID=A0ABY7CD67_9BASI|nr:uncharacterized protein PtA15_3A228 [Puccinia triticina]WAQ82863.1 hypothetical protein PtA15_3A228 [Puccinia triticina]